MANVLLTDDCVRSCPYCFAREEKKKKEPGFLSWDDFIHITDMHEISGQKAIALLGGEPTLHPYFVEFVMYLIERNIHVNVFTSGIMSDEKFQESVRWLAGVHPEKLSFVCNINHPEISPPSEQEKIKRFLQYFGHFTVPGYNIYKKDFDLSFLFQLINEYGLKRHLRVGIAHPIIGYKNKFIKIEEIKDVGRKLVHFFPVFERLKIRIGFDCGFPMCMFSEEELGRLFKLNNGVLRFTCGPVFDIGHDGKVWSCFPLKNYHQKSIYDFNTIQEIIRFYEDLHRRIRVEAAGIYEECDSCEHRQGDLCMGGCLAHLITRFDNEPRIRMQEVYS
jgi:radical SAM protein with 4Fe4S-binding SPASM domain